MKTAERQVTLARRQREAAAGQLRIDLDADGDFLVTEPEPTLPPKPAEAILLQRAEETRGDVAQARSAQRIADLEVAKQKGAYFPTITADAGYVWQKTAFPTDRYGFAALRFNVPIWQSGEIGARVAVAAGRLRQARLSLAEATRTAQEDVRRALLDLETAETASPSRSTSWPRPRGSTRRCRTSTAARRRPRSTSSRRRPTSPTRGGRSS